PPPTVPVTNGAARVARDDRPTANGPAPRSRLLARLTSLTSVASVAAAGMIVVGVLAVVGGNYDKQVVHDQLAPQKIFFPAAGSPALLPGIKQYAGQQVLTGSQAKAYADKFINVHLSEVAGGKTYAQVSAAAIAAPNDPKLAAQKATLFQGETLRGLLLGGWGWSMIGTIATLAGIILIAFGAVLFILPLMNWRINLRPRSAAPAGS
ncbi:MAG: hypothetical protein QOC55_2373, partial [Thermoleophilaceae bacterium]|nr:hypothetical protein [Thermoleophilaceae bacterium]